jgi:phosphate transport system substrate-binding protein
MAQQISRIPGSIGYVELSVAQQMDLAMAAIQNRKGDFVPPSPTSLITARNLLKGEVNPVALSLREPLDPAEGYPIVHYLWLLLYQEYEKAEKAKAIEQMLTWVMTEGQAFNPEFGHIPIDNDEAMTIVNQAKQAIQP